ncbi:hypothetical protein [Aureispira sp. CCB-QB1]|uniref:alginate O-acetyltransferase AlgX-related protein n=1 Tax=Aureispira sp. CCB-QB1 TaxID=1313421 RepID=UPI000698BBFF|nr:hypothetical protein [Aureispira sp. CCB-QB1]
MILQETKVCIVNRMKFKQDISKVLFCSILVLLFVPMIQEEYHWVKVGKLDGYDPHVPQDSALTASTWLTGTYQVAKEQYRERFFGFRNWAIRINNQAKYSLYRRSEADNIVVGKNNYLYGVDYVEAYMGNDFVGEDVIEAKLQRFKELQDTLSELGKHLFIIVTPNKADYFAEYLPNENQTSRVGIKTNYDYYVKGFKTHGINHIDMNQWFLDLKPTAQYPLFPQTGIHLTDYGSILFTDTLIGYVERVLDKDLPDFSWSDMKLSGEARDADNDAERALNLLFKLPYYDLPYPSIHIDDTNKYKPKSLTIGDSFYWTFVHWKGLIKVFDNGDFWYYNREVHPTRQAVSSLNLEEEIKDKEVIFIINSAFNLWRLGFGFDLDLYKHFFPKKVLEDKALLEILIQERMITARKDKKWMALLEERATNAGVPFEKMLYDNVAYVIKQKLQKQ